MEKKKRGFTLIELIVVLAILAIIAAIAIPSAFKGLEKARDKAARSSVMNIAGIVKTGAGLGQLDKKLIASVSKPGKNSVVAMNGEKGVFTEVAEVGCPISDMTIYLAQYLNDCAIQMDEKAAVSIRVGFNSSGVQTITYVIYYPNGFNKEPIYYYDSMLGTISGGSPLAP